MRKTLPDPGVQKVLRDFLHAEVCQEPAERPMPALFIGTNCIFPEKFLYFMPVVWYNNNGW